MNIELTEQEAQFIFENIGQLNVPISNPNAQLIAQLGTSVLTKIKDALTAQVKQSTPEGRRFRFIN